MNCLLNILSIANLYLQLEMNYQIYIIVPYFFLLHNNWYMQNFIYKCMLNECKDKASYYFAWIECL